jgi:hypothetical protein
MYDELQKNIIYDELQKNIMYDELQKNIMYDELQKNIWKFKNLENDEIKLGKLCRDVNNLIVTAVAKKGTEDNANMIINGIWLGNYNAANDFNFIINNKIKYIINACDIISNNFSSVKYLSFPMSDNDICQKNFFKMIIKAAAIINKAISENYSVLIHCKRGHHRSASIVTYYLMMYHNLSLLNAVKLIKNIRPTAFRRISCSLKTLILYEHNRSQLSTEKSLLLISSISFSDILSKHSLNAQ